MTTAVSLLDVAFVVALDNHSPTLLNLDFLRLSGVVPEEWEVARPPVFSQQVSQILFANGISMVAQPDRVVVLAPLADSEVLATEAAWVAQRYVQALPNGKYQAVGINLRGYLQGAGVANYFQTNLLQSGPWLEEGLEPVTPSLTLNYTLSSGALTLNISPAQLQFGEESPLQSILFAGNYNSTLDGSGSDRLLALQQRLSGWQRDVHHFRRLVSEAFQPRLVGADPLFSLPVVAAA
jgi:hypothetical protein